MGVMSKPVLALASAGSVVVFLGLAILGWGGFAPFFANPARIALVVVTAASLREVVNRTRPRVRRPDRRRHDGHPNSAGITPGGGVGH